MEHFSAGSWASAAGDGSAPCPEQLNEGGGEDGASAGVGGSIRGHGAGGCRGMGGLRRRRNESVGGAVAGYCCLHIIPKLNHPIK